MASRGINVKIERTKLIAELTKRLDEMQNAINSYEVELAKYEANYEKWKDSVTSIVKRGKHSNFYIPSYRGYDNKFRIELTWEIDRDLLPSIPEEPEQPYSKTYINGKYVGDFNDRKAEILNAIRILEMSDDEFVNASTYGAVSKYL